MKKIIILFIFILLWTWLYCFESSSIHKAEKRFQNTGNDLSKLTNNNNHKKSNTLKIKYLANEGIFINGKHNSILIDALFEEDFGIYQKLKRHTQDSIINGLGDYKKIDCFLITHKHKDHFSKQLLIEFIKNHSETIIISSSQVIEELKKFNTPFNYSVHLTNNGNDSHNHKLHNISITTYLFRHPYRKNYSIENLVFIVEIEGKTIAHLGDSEWSIDLIKKVLKKKYKIDYTFLPFWFSIEFESKSIIKKFITNKKVYFFHLMEKFNDSYNLTKYPILSNINSWVKLN